MIEKAFLPVRLVNSEMKQFFANDVAHRLNPCGQGDAIRWKGSKEMNVIRHYDITTNRDIMLLRVGRKHAKCLMDFISCQQASAFIRVKGDEVERPDVSRKDGRAWEDVVAIVWYSRVAWLIFYRLWRIEVNRFSRRMVSHC
jgi:hypothetical protein